MTVGTDYRYLVFFLAMEIFDLTYFPIRELIFSRY